MIVILMALAVSMIMIALAMSRPMHMVASRVENLHLNQIKDEAN